jgi:hypothetical protein
MLEMDPNEHATMDVMRLEETRKWIPGTAEGFSKQNHKRMTQL